MSESLRLDAIEFTAGTQVRQAIDESIVAEYADLLKEGVQFPPIIVFHDGSDYFPADGFHRALAHSRVGRETISADVHLGTREDALWFALGANKANGLRLTRQDKRHAVLLAIKAWPERTQSEIAIQVGCSQGYVSTLKEQQQVISANNLSSVRVTGRDGKSYPASTRRTSKKPEIERLVREGVASAAICEQLKASKTLVAEVRRELRVGRVSQDPSSVEQRRVRIREMAAGGYSTPQIATAVGLTEGSLRNTIRESAIDVPADRVMSRSRRHDANRIVEQMVMDAESLTADVNLIEFGSLDKERLGAWIDSLSVSRRSLDAFIKRLIKEMKNDEAA